MSKQTQETGGVPKMVGQLRIYYGSSGFCCGNGKLMAFPHACGESGGGAFVLVYLICIFLVGIPPKIAEK